MKSVITFLGILSLANAVLAPTLYDRHVVFDNSLADRSYYHSEARVVAPSRLEIADGKIPVDAQQFVTAPNGLRLKWRSAPGGDWRAVLKVPTRYGRSFEFTGDTLTFWCRSDTVLTPANSPRIAVQDARGVSAPAVPLAGEGSLIPAGEWRRVRLPFGSFALPFNATDDVRFGPHQLVSVTFTQGLDDDAEHMLFLDDVQVVDGAGTDAAAPALPTGLTVRGHERHFELAWAPVADADLLRYRIYRSWEGREFTPVGVQQGTRTRFVEFTGTPVQRVSYRVSAEDVHGNESPSSLPAGAATRPFTDDELLGMVQEACFRYYWDGAHPTAGMALEILPGDEDLVAVGASGFGIMSLVVAAERGMVTRESVVERLLRIVRFLAAADRFHGAWPHFLDGRTGRVVARFGKYDNGGDLVETAFLVQGLLVARQYFDRDDAAEREIRATCTRLWQEVEWDWYRREAGSDVLYWHWSPDHDFHISHPLIGWNETMIVYLLAIASPTHGVPASLYHTGWGGQSARHVRYRQNWGRTTAGDHYTNGLAWSGIPLAVGVGNGGELFFTQFSFLGFDPRGLRDAYANYEVNNRNIARINHAYCVANPRGYAGYGLDCWGLSAGIRSGGGRPLPRDDNGTLCCSAALASFPWTPRESFAALRHFYRELGAKVWGIYGFHDGFNQAENWFEEVYMGLNQGPIVVMIENHRTGLVWRHFMANPEIGPALRAIGFTADP